MFLNIHFQLTGLHCMTGFRFELKMYYTFKNALYPHPFCMFDVHFYVRKFTQGKHAIIYDNNDSSL